MGIEPTPSAWKAEVLPLNYTRSASRPLPVEAYASLLTRHGGGGRIRTYEGISRQIYSLLPLAAWVPLRGRRAAYSRWAAGAMSTWRSPWNSAGLAPKD
jgi:hypothetical protein